jgi:hypothetical protein
MHVPAPATASSCSARRTRLLLAVARNSNRPGVASDLNETSLEQAVIDIAGYTDERGLLIAARPRKLIVPPALMFVATRLLQTELRVGTADNDLNALRKSNGSIPEGYRVNHYLTDNDAWFLTTDIPNGMKHFVRTPLATSMDGDFDTGNVRYKARERYSFGVSDPLGVYGSRRRMRKATISTSWKARFGGPFFLFESML